MAEKNLTFPIIGMDCARCATKDHRIALKHHTVWEKTGWKPVRAGMRRLSTRFNGFASEQTGVSTLGETVDTNQIYG